MSGIKIIPAGEAQLPELSLLEKSCFSLPWSLEALRFWLNRNDTLTLAALQGEKVCGYLGAYRVLDEVYLANLAVFPKEQRKGIGEQLLRALLLRCEAENASFVSLEVRESNLPARALYEKLGFEKAGKRKKFYDDPPEDGVIYTLYFTGTDESKVPSESQDGI